MRPIRLAIVDDSTFVRKALNRIMEAEPNVCVVGTAASGEELLDNIGKWRPEVITLDLKMPGMGGLATLDRIMAWRDVPVIILSTHSSKDAPLTIESLHRGAVDFIDKQQHSLVDFDGLRKVLVEKILNVTGNDHRSLRSDSPPPVSWPELEDEPLLVGEQPLGLVVIGASTGGPPTIQSILQQLHFPMSVPVVVVQHMPVGFTTAFAQRLDSHLPFPVSEPVHGEELKPGSVYIAAAGAHLLVEREGKRLVAKKRKYPERMSHRPSIDILFASAAKLNKEDLGVVGVLLTGMGRDGAAGLAELARRGAYTISQNEATCVIYGMPKVAQELGAVREELPLPKIAPRINQLLYFSSSKTSGNGVRDACPAR